MIEEGALGVELSPCSRVHMMLQEGLASRVFVAFCQAITGTEVRVGCTEDEDADTITAQQVTDYIEGFLDAERDQLEHLYEENGVYGGCAEDSFCTRREALYQQIAEALEPETGS